jgi:hypothetical protein
VVAGGRPSGVRPRASARSRGSARAVAHSRFGHVAAASARYGAADEGPELSSQSELRLARIAAMGALVALRGVDARAGLTRRPEGRPLTSAFRGRTFRRRTPLLGGRGASP